VEFDEAEDIHGSEAVDRSEEIGGPEKFDTSEDEVGDCVAGSCVCCLGRALDAQGRRGSVLLVLGGCEERLVDDTPAYAPSVECFSGMMRCVRMGLLVFKLG
jgi:hypothetical protein